MVISRLIDADKLIDSMDDRYKEKVNNVPDNLAEGFMQMEKLIKEQPTAFDVGKVISNIWDRSELIHIKHNCYDEVEDYIRVTDVSEIVKAGGLNE